MVLNDNVESTGNYKNIISLFLGGNHISHNFAIHIDKHAHTHTRKKN